MEQDVDMQYIFQIKMYIKQRWVDSSAPLEKCEIMIKKISELYDFSIKDRKVVNCAAEWHCLTHAYCHTLQHL